MTSIDSGQLSYMDFMTQSAIDTGVFAGSNYFLQKPLGISQKVAPHHIVVWFIVDYLSRQGYLNSSKLNRFVSGFPNLNLARNSYIAIVNFVAASLVDSFAYKEGARSSVMSNAIRSGLGFAGNSLVDGFILRSDLA